MGAFIGWSVVPEFWDEQPFILVDYLPLRRMLMADAIATRLKAIAGKSTTSADEKAQLEKLASEPEPAYAALAAFAPRLPSCRSKTARPSPSSPPSSPKSTNG